MKLTLHNIGHMLAGIAKPWKENHRIFINSYWGWESGYLFSLYVKPLWSKEENLTTYYNKVYCSYTLTTLNGSPVKEYYKTFNSKEDFESFIEEVRSLKERYIG